MDKSILFAIAAVTSVSTIATVYYVSPVENVSESTPAVLVNASPIEVIARIRQINLDRYIVHFYGEDFRDRDQVSHLFHLAKTNISDMQTIFDLKYGSELLMQFIVTVRPIADSKSEVEVETVAGKSRFSNDPILHPYDINLLQSVADFLATDYVSSIVKGHPLLTGKALEKELVDRFAQDGDSVRPTTRRIEKAFLAAYGDELRAETESYAQSDYGSFDQSDNATEAAAEASMNAATAIGSASDAVAAAADAAAAQAEAAKDAAEAAAEAY
jgi:hypothetical protein